MILLLAVTGTIVGCIVAYLAIPDTCYTGDDNDQVDR